METVFQLSFSLVHGDDDFDFRSVKLTPSETFTLGRASKDQSKELFPAGNNLWLTSPVISRHHARLSYSPSTEDPYVTLTDLSSSHGTFLIRDQNLDAAAAVTGGERCETGTAVKICNGDILRFGAKVTRGTEIFSPPIFQVLISKSQVLISKSQKTPVPSVPATSMPTPTSPENKSPGKSFSVPDASSGEESDMDIEDDYSIRSRSPAETSSVREVSPWSSPSSPVYEPPASPGSLSNSSPDPPSELEMESYSPSMPTDEEDGNDQGTNAVVPSSDPTTISPYASLLDTIVPSAPVAIPPTMYQIGNGNGSSNYDYLSNLQPQMVPWPQPAMPPVGPSISSHVNPPTLHPQDLLVNVPAMDYGMRQQKMDIQSLISPEDPSASGNRKRTFSEFDNDEDFMEIPDPGPFRKISQMRGLRSVTKHAAAIEGAVDDSQKAKEPEPAADVFSTSTTFSLVVARQADSINSAQTPQSDHTNKQLLATEPFAELIQDSESRDQEKLLSQAKKNAQSRIAMAAFKRRRAEKQQQEQDQAALSQPSTESQESTPPQRVDDEPPRKRSRLGDLALGIVIGGITTVAALVTLPDSFFA